MPYLTPQAKAEIDAGRLAKTSGELNYQITRLAIAYIIANGMNYQTLNDIDGALDNARLEFNRRVTAPYEDTKIESNGDVYPSLEELMRFKR